MPAPPSTNPQEPGQALDDLLRRGRAAWPELRLSLSEVERHLAPHLEGVGRGPRDLCAEDLYLACGCALGSPAALAAFEQRFLALVDLFLARSRPAPSFVDEVKQALRVKLLVAAAGSTPKIAEYSGRGSLQSWLRVAALRTAIDLRRQQGASGLDAPFDEGDGEGPAGAVAGGRDPELDLLKGRYKGEFKSALQASLSALPSEQRNVLKLYLVDGLNVVQIGALLRIHRSTVARWISSAREAILRETQRLLQARLRVSAGEVESLARLVQSQLDVSLARLLGDARVRGARPAPRRPS